MAADRTDNFNAQMQQLKNVANDVRITLGSALMPMLTDAAGTVGEGALKIAEFIEENKELIATLTKVGFGLGIGKIAFLALKAAVLKVKGVYLGVKAVKAGYAAAQAAMNANTKISIALQGKELKTTSALIGAYAAKGKALALTTAAMIKDKVAVIAGTAAKVKAKIATWALNTALLANPIVLIIMAVIAAVAAIIAIVVLLVKNWDKVKEAAERVWETVKLVFQKIWDFIKAVWEGIKAAFSAAWEFIKGVFSAVGGFFSGVWGKITGVFANVVGWFGDKFRAAWEAIKNVFSAVGGFFKGIWDNIVGIFGKVGTAVGDAIGGAFKAVVNGVVGFAERIINGFFGTINRAIGVINKIPGVNIPLIPTISLPKLEKGSNYTPKNFIAGDVGGKGGEIVADARGRKVFTAAQTSDIFKNIKAAMAINKAAPVSDSDTIKDRVGGLIGALRGAAASRAETMAQKPLSSMPMSSGGGTSFTIEYSPTIHVSGDVPGDLEEKLKENNENLLQLFKDFLRQQREDEGRMVYA
jgi:phage-related minor tail protein